jgi:hypothetical protein
MCTQNEQRPKKGILMPLIRQPNYDLNKRPFLVIWETTRACDLSCRHCRAESIPVHDPNALTTEEGFHLLADIEQFGAPPPLVILTGGDPFKRADIFDLTAHGASLTANGGFAFRHAFTQSGKSDPLKGIRRKSDFIKPGWLECCHP